MPSILEPKNNHIKNKKCLLYLLNSFDPLTRQDIIHSPLVDTDNNIIVFSPNPTLKCSESYIPCLSENCQFIKYQQVFHPSLEKWYLPSLHNKTSCIVCEGISNKTLHFSDIKVSKNKLIGIYE